MSNQIECIVAGGPQHGSIFQRQVDNPTALPPVIRASDGCACAVAARRISRRDMRARCVLLHPRATGQQFLSMLALAN